MVGDAFNKLAGEAMSDFRVDIARASAARSVLAGVGTSAPIVMSVGPGVAGASAAGDPCNATLRGERLRDLFLLGFGVVGIRGSTILAIFVEGASAEADDAFGVFLSLSIAAMTS